MTSICRTKTIVNTSSVRILALESKTAASQVESDRSRLHGEFDFAAKSKLRK